MTIGKGEIAPVVGMQFACPTHVFVRRQDKQPRPHSFPVSLQVAVTGEELLDADEVTSGA